MSTKEKAIEVLNSMTEEQLQGFIMMFGSLVKTNFAEEIQPDECDRALIEDSKKDNDEIMPLDDFVKNRGLLQMNYEYGKGAFLYSEI